MLAQIVIQESASRLLLAPTRYSLRRITIFLGRSSNGQQGTCTTVPKLMVPKILLLVEQVGSRRAQVYDLRAPVAILLEPRTLEAVESVRYALTMMVSTGTTNIRAGGTYLATADNTLVLIVTKGALVAYPHQRCRSHVAVADGAFAVAFVAETTDGDARLLAAHYEVACRSCQFGCGRHRWGRGTYG